MVTFPGESAEYRAARDRLLAEEIELRRRTEAVAAARRALPLGGVVPQNYVFDAVSVAGDIVPVELSSLFTPGRRALVAYSMMFPRDRRDGRPAPASGETSKLALEQGPCPSCVALLDQLDGAAAHVAPELDFVVVAKAPIARVVTFAKERGWRHLRFVSSAKNTYNGDYHAETYDGMQLPMLNVFTRDGDVIRHFWGSEMLQAPADPGQDPRHLGMFEPLWNLFDVTREGRGATWEEQLEYPATTPRDHCC